MFLLLAYLFSPLVLALGLLLVSIRALILYRRNPEKRQTQTAFRWTIFGLFAIICGLIGAILFSYELNFSPPQTESVLGAGVWLLFTSMLVVFSVLLSFSGFLFSFIYQSQNERILFQKVRFWLVIILLILAIAVPATMTWIRISNETKQVAAQKAKEEEERKINVGLIGGITEEKAISSATDEIGYTPHKGDQIRKIDDYSPDLVVWEYSTTLCNKNDQPVLNKTLRINAKDGSIVTGPSKALIKIHLLKQGKPLNNSEVVLKLVSSQTNLPTTIDDYAISDNQGNAYLIVANWTKSIIFFPEENKSFGVEPPIHDYTINLETL